MKKITLNLFKGLLVIVLFTGVSVAISTTGVQTVNEAKALGGGNTEGEYCSQGTVGRGRASQVSAANVNQYLFNKGYTVYSISPISGTTSWVAYTEDSNGIQYRTILLIQSSGVVRSEDCPL